MYSYMYAEWYMKWCSNFACDWCSLNVFTLNNTNTFFT